MTNLKTKTAAASLMLIIAAAIWGASFVVMKNTLDVLPTNTILAVRFSIGALGLSFMLVRYRRSLCGRLLIHGALVGAALYAAFAIQTYGLALTTVGENAFITAIYVVLVPLLMWGLRRKRPSANELIAALLCLAGIGVLSLGGAGALSGKMLGYGLTLLSGVLFALHICLVGVFTDDGDNIMMLTCLQFMFAALFAWTASLLFEAPAVSITPDTWLSLAYVGIAATLIALLFQNIGIKYASPSYASLFLCLEAPFGCIFGVMFLGEKLELRMIVGCAIIVAGLALAQIKKRTNKSPTDKTTGTEVNL